MQYALIGQANILSLPIVAKATGNPIIAGTVNFYLVDKEGANANKWYRGADTSWQAAEAIAGAATHRADGGWYLSFPSAVWVRNVRYRLYGKEDGDLHIPVGEDVLGAVALSGSGATATVYTVLDGDTNPIDGVSVWVSTDLAGTNVVASGTTDDSGEVTFMLDSGTTYYLWSQKAGYNFTNPDTEVVP